MSSLTPSTIPPAIPSSAPPLSPLASSPSASSLPVSCPPWNEHTNLILGAPQPQSGSYVTINNANTIWVQDQPFVDWRSAWAWVNQIKYSVTRKGCAIDLISQKIRFENASAKSSTEIDELIKRDWVHLGLDKKEKKELRAGLTGYIRAGKSNEKRRTSCLLRVSKYWGIEHRERFAMLHYPRYNKTFFRKVTTVVKLATTAPKRTFAIQKLNNIIISRLQNPRPSVQSDKWRHNTSQDWEQLGKNFDRFSPDLIRDETLMALYLHLSSTGYVKDGAPRFPDVTDADDLILSLGAGLDRRPEREEEEKNNGIPVTNSEEEARKKKNQRTERKKARLESMAQQAPPPPNVGVPPSGPSLPDVGAPLPGPPDVKAPPPGPPDVEAPPPRLPDVGARPPSALRYPPPLSPITPTPSPGYTCRGGIRGMPALRTPNPPPFPPHSRFKRASSDEPRPRLSTSPA